MSVRLAEAARAFVTIADYLPPDERKKLAEKIAGLIDSSITPSSKPAPAPQREVLPDPVHAEFEVSAKFLADHGYSSADQVRAAGRLEEFLKRHPNLTREAGMRVWLTEEAGMSR